MDQVYLDTQGNSRLNAREQGVLWEDVKSELVEPKSGLLHNMNLLIDSS